MLFGLFASLAVARIGEDGELVDAEWLFVGCVSVVLFVTSVVASNYFSLFIKRAFEGGNEVGKVEEYVCACACACGKGEEQKLE